MGLRFFDVLCTITTLIVASTIVGICSAFGLSTHLMVGGSRVHWISAHAVVFAVVYGAWRAHFLSGDQLAMKSLMFFRPFKLIAAQTLVEAERGAAGGGAVVRYAVRRLTFALPPPADGGTTSLASLGFDLGLGDFVQVQAPGGFPPRVRAYSPASPEGRAGSFDLVVKCYGGQVSGHLEELEVGETALLSGPGPVPWMQLRRSSSGGGSGGDGGAPIGLVAFGVGITEALPVARSELERGGGSQGSGSANTVTLLWANRGWADVFWRQELEAMQEKYGRERFAVVHALSREQPRGGCEHGRVDRALLQRVFAEFDRTRTRFLVVGTKAMKKSAVAHLAALGFSGPALLKKRPNPLPWTWRSGPNHKALQAEL
jgi:NAD(P)H-flavin reductase